jgi:hypothetical protein
VGNVMVYGFGIGVANERGHEGGSADAGHPCRRGGGAGRCWWRLAFALVSIVVLIVFGVVVGGIRQD